MNRRVGYAREVARAVLQRHGIKQPPVDLKIILEKEGIEYEEADYFPDDVDAMIIPTEGAIVAVVNMKQHPNRRRFSLAHELGHYFMNHDRSEVLDRMTVDWEEVRQCRNSKDPQESEADIFASELLIPLAFLKKVYTKAMTIPDVAEIFQVSEAAASVAITTHFKSLF